MPPSVASLSFAAISIAFVHTLLGPDHYLPFVAMSKAGRWSLRKTMCVVALCGLGHVLSSVLLGLAGFAIGGGLLRLQGIERLRGDLAAWLLLAFGVAYFAWGVRRALRHQPHAHVHAHADGTVHSHAHGHEGEHLHVHDSIAESGSRLSPWVLFTIFLFGPCEPLIPLVMVPAAQHHPMVIVWVTALFGVTTIGVMLAVVTLALRGTRFLPAGRFARFGHAAAGFILLACGAAMMVGI